MSRKRKCNTELLKQLYLDGMAVDDIAPKVGLQTGASVSWWASKIGLPLRNVRGVNDDRDAAIYAASKAGVHRNELAELHGISPRTVEKIIQQQRRAENGPSRVSRKGNRAAKVAPPPKPVTPEPKQNPQRVRFGFTPAAIKRWESRA